METSARYITVKTKTKTGNFGTVLYRIEQDGLGCSVCGGNDGVKCVMVGGTGPSATKGLVVFDCQKRIESDLASGTSKPVEGKAEIEEIIRSFHPDEN